MAGASWRDGLHLCTSIAAGIMLSWILFPRGSVSNAASHISTSVSEADHNVRSNGSVPVISVFFGIVIRMFYREHGVAHFHAEH